MGRFLGCAMIGGALVLAAGCGSSSKTVPGDERVCEAGARRCDGLNIKVCSDDGMLEGIEETCLPSQTCADGACAETECVPNTKFCNGPSIYKCDSSGGGSELKQTCPVGKFCVEDDGNAECAETACKAGQPLCDGDFATKCAADGTGPEPGGTDCAATDQACMQGTCRDLTCIPRTKQCQDGNVYLCDTTGMQLDLLAECREDEVCDGEKLACRPKLCEPGAVDCDGTRIVECNEYGTARKQAGADCAADNKVCVSGTCKARTCSPNSTFCQDGDVYQCDNYGVSSSLYLTCNPEFQHCHPYPTSNYAWCEYNQCEAGETLCDGNTIKVCTDEAELPATGTDCGDDKYCDAGSCKPRGCTLYEYYCDKGDIYYCDYYGPSQAPQEQCPSETACKKVDSGVVCVALPCSAGTTSCVGNKVGTCATDGSGLGTVTQDCTTSGNVCSVDGKCAKTVEDLVGVAESPEVDFGSDLMGNVFDVTAPRKLTEIALNLVLAGSRELRWVIFEQSGTNFVARIDKVVSNQSGAGFASSGPLNFTLKAGKRYLLGVAVSGGDSVSYYDAAPWSPHVSFGSTLGYVHVSYAAQVPTDWLYTDRLYQMRLTTEAVAP